MSHAHWAQSQSHYMLDSSKKKSFKNVSCTDSAGALSLAGGSGYGTRFLAMFSLHNVAWLQCSRQNTKTKYIIHISYKGKRYTSINAEKIRY